MSAVDPSELRFRDRVVKHMTTGAPPVRPADYGRQSNRLLGELTDGIRAEDASRRGRLNLRSQFEQLREGDLGQAMLADMTGDGVEVAPDQDVFGAAALSRAMQRVRKPWALSSRRFSEHDREVARQASAEHDATLATAAAELEERRQTLEAERTLAEYPDMDPETALLIAGAGEEATS